MRILHINRSDVVGGAAVAASRIVAALLAQGQKADLLVAEKLGDGPAQSIVTNKVIKYRLLYNFLYEVITFLPYEHSRKVRFAFSLGRKGFNLAHHPLVKEADVIHLHWFNQGFLSLKNLKQLLSLNKPIVWTLHDMWSFTGGCHYAGECSGYRHSCGYCPLLLHPAADDLSYRQYKVKEELYKPQGISFVTCSEWLKGEARKASLLRDSSVVSIPNPIDVDLYAPKSMQEARRSLGLPLQRKLLLFGAANVSDPRKGMHLLKHALQVLGKKEGQEPFEIVIFGKAPDDIASFSPFPVHPMGYINDTKTLVDMYNACNVFVLPSLEDNLPNTVMESLACGTPVAAFRIGGVPEMITHGFNGFLAAPANARGLAEGIDYLLFKCKETAFRQHARKKVMEVFTPQIVADKYLQLYEQLLSK